jgi:hypothetical protein
MIYGYFAVLIFSVVAGFLDALSSQNGIYYSCPEGSSFVRDEYGYHSNIKELYKWGPIYAAGFVAPFLPFFTQDQLGYVIGMVLYGIIGAYRLNESFHNKRIEVSQRAAQQLAVDSIRQAIVAGDPSAAFMLFNLYTYKDHTSFAYFQWLWVVGTDPNAARPALIDKVVAWVKLGATFPK